MTDMIERVARAINPDCWEQEDAGGGVITHPSNLAHSMKQARAAIAAMREPTEDMVEAGYYDAMAEDAKATFTAMIDAALECSTKQTEK